MKKKRIGILTFHFSNHNYGAVLQTFASYSFLVKLGYKVKIINLRPTLSIILAIKLFIIKIIRGAYIFDRFRNRYLDQTKKIHTTNQLSSLNNMFDIFYVGSDQVWRPSMANKLLKHYFLDFVDNTKLKISYAASFGVTEWISDELSKETVTSLLSRFNAISVREEEGVSMCLDNFNTLAVNVIDPTLLLMKEDYFKVMEKDKVFPKTDDNYIAYYMLTDRNCNGIIIKHLSDQLKNPVYNLYKERYRLFGRIQFRYRRVETWLAGLYHCSFLVTDSYHGLLFAIIFKKNFVCLPNARGGVSRIKNITKALGIEDRFCESKIPDFDYYYNHPVDFHAVYLKLEALRKQSKLFLLNALGKSSQKQNQ